MVKIAKTFKKFRVKPGFSIDYYHTVEEIEIEIDVEREKEIEKKFWSVKFASDSVLNPKPVKLYFTLDL